jgi:AcrR family transcriptional regulator
MTAQPARRTQAERRIESERNLLKAAVEVIASQGVGAVTFEALGRTGGFSRGLATQRFGSKQKLIEALLAHLHERQEELLREHRLDERPGLEAILTYTGICIRNLAAGAEGRAYSMLLSSSIADLSSLRSGFREVHAEVEARLSRWIVRGQAEGRIRPEVDPAAAALMIGCLVFGISMQLIVDPGMDLEPVCRTSLATLQASLAVAGQA